MAIQFIFGRSGFGKTRHCFGEIVDCLLEDSDQSLLLLVPAQATYQAEKAILNDDRIAGYNRLNVLSFERLAYLLHSKNIAAKQISPIGQEMIVHRILRQNADRLSVFGSSAVQPGLAGELTKTIIELHRYCQSPGDIDELIKGLEKDKSSESTKLKFADIRLIFQEYLKFIEPKFTNPDAQLSLVRKRIADSDFIRGANLWVDGYASFTTQELQILAELLKTVSESKIALCLDPTALNIDYPETDEPDPTSLFCLTEKTYKELVELIRRCKLPISEPIILEEPLRFSAAAGLAHIEQNIFNLGDKAKIKAGENIRIISAANARGEANYVARQIHDLVRNKKFRFRDIAIVASDIEDYQHYLEAVLTDYNIPFFIDRRKSLQQCPVVELLGSALAVAVGDILNVDIFSCLKSDLVEIDRYQVDLLENYCIAFGIDSNDWTDSKDWQFAGPGNTDFDEQQINSIRQKALVHLLSLRRELNDAETITAEIFRDVIFDFLENLQIRKKLDLLTEQGLERNNLEYARRLSQLWDNLTKTFDELVEIFSDLSMPVADYSSIINNALLRLTLAIIPPSLDEVLIGSIERSRHPDLKAVFLIGASQRQFPVPISSESILTDEDRTVAAHQNFILAETSSQQLSKRQYLAYIAFTRPAQYLYITYPLADDRGTSLVPSQFLTELQGLFTDLKFEMFCSDYSDTDLSGAYSYAELADLLCAQPGSTDRLQFLLGQMRGEPCLVKTAEFIDSAVNYSNDARLENDFIKLYLAETLHCSATQLSAFAACPYKYFARYNLKVKERKLFTFEMLDLGKFYHGLLEELFAVLQSNNTSFASALPEQLVRYLDKAVTAFIGKDAFIQNFCQRGRHNSYIIDSACEVLQDLITALSQMAKASSFTQIAAEMPFGMGGKVGAYEITLSGGKKVLLRGKIDRLDIAEIDGKTAALVFDYKTSETSINWKKLYYGLDLQLPIYLLALQGQTFAGKGALDIVGAFNMPVQINPPLSTLGEVDLQTDKFRHKAKGIFDGRFYSNLDHETTSSLSPYYNFTMSKSDGQYGRYKDSGAFRGEDFQKLMSFAESKIKFLAEQIYEGNIGVKPYQSSCNNCPYRALCRFDWQINDYNVLGSVSKSQIIDSGGSDGS